MTAARDRYNPCGLTSSGEQFHSDRADNTASPIYPDGTTLLVWSPDNERALVVRVNNAGPYWGNRKLDLSRAAAEKLGFEHNGVAKVHVRVIKAPEPHEARYVHNRVYPPVPGDIGQYASLGAAQTGMAVALALQASAASPLAPVTTANAFAKGTIGLRAARRRGAAGAGPHADAGLLGQRSAAHADCFRRLLDPEPRRPRSVAQSHGERQAANQTAWDEDRVIDEPVKVVAAVTETSSITEQQPAVTEQSTAPRQAAEARQAPEAKKSPKARLAAVADEEDSKPRKSSKKKIARKSDDEDEDRSERRRTRREVASYEERRSYRAERDYQYRSRYAQVERNYGSGGNSNDRSAGQTMSDNFRPL